MLAIPALGGKHRSFVLTGQQLGQLGEFQANERLRLKKKKNGSAREMTTDCVPWSPFAQYAHTRAGEMAR